MAATISPNRTTNHDTIRKWAEARHGKPATVKSTERGGEPGVLRIDFPGHSGERTLQHISWDDFFEKFDSANLSMVYQTKNQMASSAPFANS